MRNIDLRNLAFNISLNDMASGPVGNVDKSMDEVKKSMVGVAKQSDTVQERFKKMGKGMEKTGKFLTTRLTLPIMALGTKAVHTVAQFDDSMSKVKGITQASNEEFDKMRELAKELGSTTAHSASAAADGMGILAAAGYETNQILAATPHLLSLASAGDLGLEQSAGIITGTIAMYGMEKTEEDFARVSDVMAKAAMSAKTSVPAIGEAMNMAGGAAANMNMDIEQTNAILGVFANQNIEGGRAGRTFVAMQSDLAKSAENGRIAIGNQSVAVFDAQGAWRDMGSIIGDVEAATKGMTDEQRESMLMDTFNVQSMKGVNALLKEGSAGYKEMEKRIYDSKGAASALADDMEDNLAGAFRGLKSATEGFMIDIGDVIKDDVRAAAEWLTELAGRFGKLDESTQKTILVVVGLVAVLGPIILIVGKVISVVTALGGVLAFIISPVGLVIAAIVGLVAIFVHFYRTNDKFREVVGKIWGGLKKLAGTVVEGIAAGWNGLIDVFNKVKDGISSAADTVREKWEGIKEFMKNPIKGTIELAKKGAGWVADKISGSHATGAYNIPYNDYLMQAHKGEMVLTAKISDQFREIGGTHNQMPPISNIANQPAQKINTSSKTINKVKEVFTTKTIDNEQVEHYANTTTIDKSINSEGDKDTILFNPVYNIELHGGATDADKEELRKSLNEETRKLFELPVYL